MSKTIDISRLSKAADTLAESGKSNYHRFSVAPMLDWTYKLNNYFNKQ